MNPDSKLRKILVVMKELSAGQSKPLQYEDIVVAAFRRFPEDFQLRGYPQFPDSSDIHKPLYRMKQEGLVRSANKRFILTAVGLEAAQGLFEGNTAARDRLTKSEETEVNRIAKSQAYRMFCSGEQASILDTDFYDYLGASVRTPKSDFVGRLTNVRRSIEAHQTKRHDEMSLVLERLHEWITKRFADEINARS